MSLTLFLLTLRQCDIQLQTGNHFTTITLMFVAAVASLSDVGKSVARIYSMVNVAGLHADMHSLTVLKGQF